MAKCSLSVKLTEIEPFRSLILDLDQMIRSYNREENYSLGYMAIAARFMKFKDDIMNEKTVSESSGDH